MSPTLAQCEHVTKRTTIEIDEELLARAKRALGTKTARATVEGALRRVVQLAERTSNQQRYLHQVGAHADITVLESKEMWR